MKRFAKVLICLLLIKLVNCLQKPSVVEVTSYLNHATDDSYEFFYTLSDGQSRSEKGVLTKVGDTSVYEVTGSYSFKGTDGKTYLVDYTSGVDGYKAKVTELNLEKSSVILGISPDVIKSLIG